jgi:hypothetical protein
MVRSRSSQVIVSTRPVKCTLDDEIADFALRYVLSQDGLLDHILGECKDALDLMPNEEISIAVRVGTDSVPLSSDAETRELLHLTEDSDVLELTATRVMSRHHNAVSTTIRKAVRCTLGDDTAMFELNFVVSQDGLLDFLQTECKDQLDLMPNESIRLEMRSEGDTWMPVTADAILREVLMRDGDLVLVASVGTERQVLLRKQVTCTLNGETAEFELRYSIDQDHLLEALLDECKAELDLLPSEHILISAVMGDDIVPLQSDRSVREILAHLQPQDHLTLCVEEVKDTAAGSPSKAAAVLSNTIRLEVTCGDDTQTIAFRLHPEEKAPLVNLTCFVRGEFELDPTANISLMLTSGTDMPAPLRCDDDVRSLVGKDEVSLHVVLPKTPEQLIEERPLNRVAELNALFYDWCDLLTTPTVEASDLQLVTGNLTVDGAPLASTHPITLRLMAMASDETVLRVEDELLPFLDDMFGELSDCDASRLCHGCRDVIEFLVDKSPLFRLRRSLSEAFRILAISGEVTQSALKPQLIAAGVPEEDVATVLAGYGSSLSRVEYNDVTEQLFGDCPQDVSELIAIVTQGKKHNHEGQQEVFLLRRNRLLADIRHAFDGVAVVNLCALAHEDVFRADATTTDLAWCVSMLSGGPHNHQDAVGWLNAALKDEIAAYNFIHDALAFKSTAIPLQELAAVCSRLNDADLEPSALIPRSNALHGLVSWALGAARLACHTRRELFPPVVTLHPRPPSARRKVDADDADDGSIRRLRGLSSPYVIHRFTTEAATGGSADNTLVVSSPTGGVPRFEPKLRHLSTDLKITEDGPISYSLRQLMAAQEVKQDHADPATHSPSHTAPPPPPRDQGGLAASPTDAVGPVEATEEPAADGATEEGASIVEPVSAPTTSEGL